MHELANPVPVRNGRTKVLSRLTPPPDPATQNPAVPSHLLFCTESRLPMPFQHCANPSTVVLVTAKDSLTPLIAVPAKCATSSKASRSVLGTKILGAYVSVPPLSARCRGRC